MINQPAGWFRDPAPRDPTAPDTLRYWDGMKWTAQTRTGTARQRRAWREEAAAAHVTRARDLLARAEAGYEEAQEQLAARSGTRAARTTADGQRLAGWWMRFAAHLVDGALVTVLGCLLAWGFLQQIATVLDRFVTRTVQAAQQGTAAPDPERFVRAVAEPLLAVTAIFLVVNLAYEVGFLKACQATPGKLALGLRVRPGELRGPLPWRSALLCWTGKSGVGLLQLLPFGLLAYGLYALQDFLWPLGDRNRQALHDKLARTYVVRRA